jgi:selenocysteine lyase/cysteine desulfurase
MNAPEAMHSRLRQWRTDTAGCGHRNHLNNAGAALMPNRVVEAMHAHLELERNIGGYEAADVCAAQIEHSYDDIAALLGASAHNVALVANATAGFVQALSTIDFRRGDTIITSRCDYASNQIQYLALQRRHGVSIVHAADLPEGGVDSESVRNLLRRQRARLVAISWVPSNAGLVQDVAAVGQVCEEFEVPYLVDACQAVGQIPIDVSCLHCDYLSFTARKFLRGPRGIGGMYASDRALERGDYPLYVDMRGARWIADGEIQIEPDARRFEDWEFPYALVLGQGAAVRYALEVGSETAQARAWALAAQVRSGLEGIPGVRVLDRGRQCCAIVTAAIRGWSAPDIVRALRERGINTSASLREVGILDFDDKGVESAVRISPHYYNTEGEIEQLTGTMAELASTQCP